MKPTGKKNQEDPKDLKKDTGKDVKPDETTKSNTGLPGATGPIKPVETQVVDPTDPTKPEEPEPEPPKLTIKQLYEKYQSEAVTRAARSGDKKYSMDDIRTKLTTIFNEIGQEKLLLSAVVKIMTDSDDNFSELRYQEVRSCVQSKKTKGFDLVNENNNSWIAKVTVV